MSILTRKRMWLNTLTIAILATIALPPNGLAADRIVARFPPLKDFAISVRDLEAFAKDGKIPADYAKLAKQTSPAQLQQFRELLQQRLKVSPTYISQFLPYENSILSRWA